MPCAWRTPPTAAPFARSRAFGSGCLGRGRQAVLARETFSYYRGGQDSLGDHRPEPQLTRHVLDVVRRLDAGEV